MIRVGIRAGPRGRIIAGRYAPLARMPPSDVGQDRDDTPVYRENSISLASFARFGGN